MHLLRKRNFFKVYKSFIKAVFCTHTFNGQKTNFVILSINLSMNIIKRSANEKDMNFYFKYIFIKI